MGRDIDQSWRVYVMDADGSNVTTLSPEGLDDTAPTWSPDGKKIAFVSQRDGNREIYVMDAGCVDLPEGCAQNAVNITRHPADDWTPAWSPDGQQLAFSSLRDGGWEVYVLDTACLDNPESCRDNLQQITADGNLNISPVWSPDGSRFAFNSKAAGNWDIYTMAPDGSDIRQVTTAPGNDLSPAWSPDGTQIAYEANQEGNVEIYVIDANGNGPPQNISNYSTANDHGPTWSPDGQLLVFYSNREGDWDIFSTTLDGRIVNDLTQTPNRDEQTPAWRP
jgi:TolB protein